MADLRSLWRTSAGGIRRSRWPGLISFFVAGVILVYAGLTLLLSIMVERILQRAGFPDAQVEPILFGWDFASTSSLKLDAGGMNRVRRVEVRFTPLGLFHRRLESITLDGVRIEVRPFGPGATFPGWVPPPRTGPTSVPASLPVDFIRVADVVATIILPTGRMLVFSPGTTIDTEAGVLSAALPVRIEHADMTGWGQLKGTLAGGAADAGLTLDRAALANLDQRIEPFFGQASAHWEEGRLTAQAHLSGTAKLRRRSVQFVIDADHGPGEDRGHFDLRLGASRLRGQVTATRGSNGTALAGEARVSDLDPALFGAPAGSIDAELKLDGTFRAGPARARLTATGSAQVDDASVKQFRVAGPVKLSLSGGETNIAVPDCVEVEARDVAAGGARFARLAAACLKSRGDDPLLAIIRLASGPPFLISAGQIARLDVLWRPPGSESPRPFSLRDMHWEAKRRGGDPAGQITAEIHDESPDPWFAPIAVTGRLGGDVPGQIALTLTASQGDGLLSFGAHMHWGPGGITGGGLHVGPLRIAPGSNWKERALPGWSVVDELAGQYEVLVEASWDRKGLDSHGTLQVREGVVAAAGIEANGIATDLKAKELWPLAMAAGQKIAIDRLDVGMPLEDVLLSFGIPAPGRVLISEARARFAGGVLNAQPFTAGLDSGIAETVVAVADLQVPAILRLIGMDGLSGTGTITGHIPVKLAKGRLTVRDARLESHHGVISYAPEHPPEALNQGQAKLALQALRNFHYDLLTLSLNGVSGGESRAVLSLRGRNPDFYDGKMVHFTLNLSGALDTILRRGISAYNIPDRVRERLENLE